MSPKSHLHHFIWKLKPFNGTVGTSRIMKSPNGQIFFQLLLHRFGPSGFHEFTGALTKLLQIGTVRGYHIEFEKLVKHTEGFSDAFYRSCFINALKDTI